MKEDSVVSKGIVRGWLIMVWIVALALVVIAGTKTVTLAQGVASAQSITGTVVTDNGPLAGATVRVQATTNSTLSAEDGSFTLAALAAGQTVTVTAWAPGYYNAKAVALPGTTPITITLHPYYATDNYEYDWYVLDGVNGSKACAVCHTAYEEWAADAHGQSAINPRFLSLYAGTDVHGNKSPSPAKTNLGIPLPPDLTQPYYGPGFVLDFPNRAGNCATCHTPVAAKMPNNKNCGWSGCHASSTSQQASDVLDPGVFPMPLTGNAAEGISCEFCHKIGDVTINKKTGLPYEDSPGILSVRMFRPSEGEDIFFGPLDDVIGKNPERIKDAKLPLMEESAFCAGCHYGVMGGVVGKEEVTGGVLVYNSFGEWLKSPYSDPESGLSCQDCHMPAMASGYFAFPQEGGVYRDGSQIHNHQMSVASNPQILQNSVTLSATARVQGGWLWVNVSIINDRVGHDVPTDSPLRQMILVVEAKDQAGKALALAYGSTLPEWAGDLGGLPGKAFAKILQDEWTGEMPTAAIWRPVRLVSDTRLPALKRDNTMYTFPAAQAGATTVEVRLVYRRAYQQLAQWKGWNDPDILMAQQTIQLPPLELSDLEAKDASNVQPTGN
jgi:hypothetical protein